MSSARPDERGFTLVEVLVALAILGLILVAFGQVISGGIAAGRRVDAVQEAVLFARSMMERLGRDLPLRPGDSTGDIAGGGTWRLAVRPWPDDVAAAAPKASVFRIDLSVDKPPARPFTLTSLRPVERDVPSR